MLGPDAIRRLAFSALEASRADQTEVVISGGESALTRFANSTIHQNVHEVEVELRIRAVAGKRIGVAITNKLDERAVRQAVTDALENALHSPEDPDFRTLPGPAPIIPVSAHARSTAAYTPEQRARDVKSVCDRATAEHLEASGMWSTREREVAVANSLGAYGYHTATVAAFKAVVMSSDSSGYAERTGVDAAQIDVAAAGEEAIGRALRSRNPEPLEAGEYPVVLEPYAVGTMLDYLAYMGLGARSVQEERSFMNELIGQRIAPENISLWDDGMDPAGIPMPFDFEAVPKQRVDLIRRGVAAGVVYDSYSAGKDGKESTGHALPSPNPAGPFPLHLYLEPGDAGETQLLEGIRRGVWVTRFHYVNPVHSKRTILTGMTRDGTFLIEDGEITRPIRNLRFTQSVLGALATVEAVGRSRSLLHDEMSGTCVPALRIGRFRFSSATQF